tara:strand:+ start:3623 stop:3901 length:279 start_codon:yes stop_codon:yes gene_type:complete
VHAWITAYGIPANPSGARRQLPPAEDLAAAVNAGATLKAVGAPHGVTGAAVADALKRGGYRRHGQVFEKSGPANISRVSLASAHGTLSATRD